MPNGVGKIYLDNPETRKKHGLTAPVKWRAAAKLISVGSTKWNGINAFIKCVKNGRTTKIETKAFDILARVNNKLDIPGENNIIKPLKRFNIKNIFGIKQASCFIYTFAPGELFYNFIGDKTLHEKAEYLPQIFYQLMQGMLYLRHVGIIHSDVAGRNIVVDTNPKTNKVLVTIVDYDVVKFMYQSVDEVVNLALSQPKKFNGPFKSGSSCWADDYRFSHLIYYAITGKDSIKLNIKLDQDDLYNIIKSEFAKMRSRGFRFTVKQLKFENWGHIKSLYPLLKAMTLLSSSNYDDCAISNEVMALLGFVNIK
ncbi:hypothetical protein BDF19DRAFT_426350 [Syncephalis fuscata]|nr:hypothetical protein BDF19DRAFT_426350 [Syncephalis fuscata]